METSKKLTWIFTAFFLLALISIGAVKVVFSIDLSNLLNYIMPIQISIVVSYFTKSSVENYAKIKTNPNTNAVQIESNGTSIEVEPSDIINHIADYTSRKSTVKDR